MDGTACGVCKLALNSLTDRDTGEIEYFHSRPWIDHDHAPVAVVLDPLDVAMSCDFCTTEEEPVTVYVGDEIIFNQQGYTPGWAACSRCDAFVFTEDLDGLAEHAANVAAARMRVQVRDPRPMWATFMATIHTRRTLTTVARLAPSRLPKARDALVRTWGDSAPKASAPSGRELGGLLASSLGQAQMDWLSSEFTTLAGAAATNLDIDEHPLTEESLPSPHGLLVWADMVASMPGRVPGYADVIAVSWTRCGEGVILVPYARVEQVIPTLDKDLQDLRRAAGWLVPVGLPINVTFGAPSHADPWIADLVRMVASSWYLMAQPGVADVSHALVDKSLKGAYRRARRPPPVVRIVDLRRRQRAAGGATGRTWSLSVRFMVSGHWRHYAPERDLRPRYITPYLKGPDGAPLKTPTPVVRVLR